MSRDYSKLTDLTKVKCDNLDWLIRTMAENPEQFDYIEFVGGYRGTESQNTKKVLDTQCGSHACIAGWAGYLARKPIHNVTEDTLADLIRIDESLSSQICLDPNFFRKHRFGDVSLEVVLPELKALLKQAMHAQNIKLVSKGAK